MEVGGGDVTGRETETVPSVDVAADSMDVQTPESRTLEHKILESDDVIETVMTADSGMDNDDDGVDADEDDVVDGEVKVIESMTSLGDDVKEDDDVKDDHIEAEMDSAFASNDSTQITASEEPVHELNLDEELNIEDRISDKISDDIALDSPSEISVSPLPDYTDDGALETFNKDDDVDSLSEVTSEKSKDADYDIDKSDAILDVATPDGDIPEMDETDFTAKLDQFMTKNEEMDRDKEAARDMTSSMSGEATEAEGMCEASDDGVGAQAESSLDTQQETEEEDASLVVQFEGSSRRTSDVSSLSFQNIVLDDRDSPSRSRRDSGASSASLPNEASDLAPTQEPHIDLDWNSVRDKLFNEQDQNSDSTSDYELIRTDCRDSVVSVGSNVDSDRTTAYSSDGANNNNNTNTSALEMERHRNSLEIRNNIPNLNKGRNYIDQSEITRSQNSAQIKKKSPGLAQRLDNPETESMVQDLSPGHDGPQLQDIRRKQNGLVHRQERMDVDNNENGKNLEVENEYDYIKIARFSEGDSYVGMRLAYSNSADSLKYKGAPSEGSEESPEKTIRNLPHRKFQPVEISVEDDYNEDTLTEIPLDAENHKMEHDRRFTLSPETTECDSAEVESVISEGPDQSSSGFPNVDDGLSSSQCSDNEDLAHDHQTPTSILRQKQRAGIRIKDLELPDNDDFHLIRNLSRPRSIQTPDRNGEQMDVDDTYSEGSGMSREALDLAMEDIKTAIQRSKSMTLKSPYHDGTERIGDPVWVKRDRDVELHRLEEMRRVRDQIERQQEEDFTRKHQQQQQLYSQQQERAQPQERLQQDGLPLNQANQQNNQHHIVSPEVDGDAKKSLSQQSRHHDGKKYHKPRGDVDSDDDVDDDVTMGRRKRGYHSLPVDEPPVNCVASDHLSSNDINMNRSSSQSRPKQSARHEVPSELYNYSSRNNHSARANGAIPRFNQQDGEYDTDEETDQLLDKEYTREEKLNIPELQEPPVNLQTSRRTKGREVIMPHPEDPTVLIEGVLFRACYLGSTQLISEGQPSKAMRMMQAQEAVGRIKMPEGETQPSTEVDLFVSTEKIMVLNTNRQEIMMDHALRTISYIADIGDLVVIMARRRLLTSPLDDNMRRKRQSKIICHVFESEEAQLIAQSIGQAFQVAYMEFLKANGIEDPGLMKEMDYQEVLNQQEIFGEELTLFSNREMQKEVIVPKLKGEALGVVIVESGWGSMVPTVVLANMSPIGAAARCGQLNIGDQIMSINGVSLVGLPLSSCINYIKASKNQTVVKLTVVQCPPVVEVCIKRPDVKYQLGFSVQNGVICSLLRGGIAERGGVRVGHRIIEINGSSVVAVPHEKIVNMLATSVGEIHMKTMPTSIFRLLTGQETPHYI